MPNYTYLTKQGYESLRTELEDLKTTGRLEIAKAIAEAREKGDLSENAEYPHRGPDSGPVRLFGKAAGGGGNFKADRTSYRMN